MLFIGTQFSILYTSMYSPAEVATTLLTVASPYQSLKMIKNKDPPRENPSPRRKAFPGEPLAGLLRGRGAKRAVQGFAGACLAAAVPQGGCPS